MSEPLKAEQAPLFEGQTEQKEKRPAPVSPEAELRALVVQGVIRACACGSGNASPGFAYGCARGDIFCG